jgi:hypothetical protein
MLSKGDIVSYNYLWAREAARTEESGRKARPACVVMQEQNSAHIFLFPITSKPPTQSQYSLPISEMECRRCGLVSPCWIICDEYNVIRSDQLYDFETLEPLGRFSPSFFDRFKTAVKKAAIEQRLKSVARS